MPSAKSEDESGRRPKVPPALLEEVFELNEELDEIRESRESGGDPAALRERLEAARKPIDLKREEHEREVEALSARWDRQATASRRGEARDARRAARALAGAELHQQPAWPPSIARPAEPGAESRAAEMGKVVGIDLGTTNSLVAYVRDGVPQVIRDASGDALVPSVVSLGEDGTFFVGREAQRRLLTAPSRTRLLGQAIHGPRHRRRPRTRRRCCRSGSAVKPAASSASGWTIASSRRRRSPRSCFAS